MDTIKSVIFLYYLEIELLNETQKFEEEIRIRWTDLPNLEEKTITAKETKNLNNRLRSLQAKINKAKIPIKQPKNPPSLVATIKPINCIPTLT